MRVKGIAGWPSWRQRFEVHPTDLGFGEEPADDDCDAGGDDDGHHYGHHQPKLPFSPWYDNMLVHPWWRITVVVVPFLVSVNHLGTQYILIKID